jgi:hypothetical protein
MKNKKVVVKDKVSAAAPKFFDASGGEVRDQASHQAAREIPGIRPATACLELHGVGNGGSVIFEIQLIVNPNTYPFLILGGSVRGDICNVPADQWAVTGGSFGPYLAIEARRIPPVNAPPNTASVISGSSCATTMSVVGFFQAPDSYAGSYGFSGSNSDFSHTTLFKGWHICP